MQALSQLPKAGYVALIRAAAWPVRRSGLMARLERGSASRARRWLRSLFAIHDIDDMVHLDLPWWTFRAIDEVERFLETRPEARVFEWGSGASTLWLAKRATSVVSVEHDRMWFALVSGKLAGRPDVTLILREADDAAQSDPDYASAKPGWQDRTFRTYATEIENHSEQFDLIVIDGRARCACLRHARSKLAPGGMIVFDNSGRSRYRAAIEGAGLAVRRLGGLTPALPYAEQTALISQDDAR